MKVFITGGTGFVGRNLIPVLLKKGWEVHSLVYSDRFSSVPLLEEVNKIQGDLLQPSQWSDKLHQIKPDIVVHMAALTPVRNSWENWQKYMEVNYFGTVNLINVLKQVKPVPQAIIYSTPEVLSSRSRRNAHVIVKEEAKTYPGTPYAISKLAAEAYVMTQPWVTCIVVRPANTYDRSVLSNIAEAREYFVEKTIIGFLTSKTINFDGPPDRYRSWMHVSDHVSAIELLMSSAMKTTITRNVLYHISPPVPSANASCLDIVKIVAKTVGREDVIITWNNNPRPYDPLSIAINGTRFMRQFPEWQPLSLHSGLERAVRNWRRVLNA
ncbi:MAG: NAD(P)-dependent oxidoreductase [Candidatus Caldarchaeum sp.]